MAPAKRFVDVGEEEVNLSFDLDSVTDEEIAEAQELIDSLEEEEESEDD